MAAALAGPSGSLVSHPSAAALHALRSTPTGPAHITVPLTGTRKIPGLRVHSSRRLHADDIAAVDGIPCTSVARTLVDVAETETHRALTKMVEQALILQVYDHDAVEEALGRAPGRAGPTLLRRVLAEIHDDPPHTANDFERDLLFLVDEENLRRPVCNAAGSAATRSTSIGPTPGSSSRPTAVPPTPRRSPSSATASAT